jgi:hypothetical protein
VTQGAPIGTPFGRTWRAGSSGGLRKTIKNESALELAISLFQGAVITAYEGNGPLKFGRKGKCSLRWTSKLESLRREVRRSLIKVVEMELLKVGYTIQGGSEEI